MKNLIICLMVLFSLSGNADSNNLAEQFKCGDEGWTTQCSYLGHRLINTNIENVGVVDDVAFLHGAAAGRQKCMELKKVFGGVVVSELFLTPTAEGKGTTLSVAATIFCK